MKRTIAILLLVFAAGAAQSDEGFFTRDPLIRDYADDWFGVRTWGAPGQFYKDSTGRVHLSGFIERWPEGEGYYQGVAFRLPQGYRPAFNERFIVSTAGDFGFLVVCANGDVWVSSLASLWVSLSGVSFKAK